MVLILHHRQVFHESLISYEIHYENMHNVRFLKEGIRRKSIISTDSILLKELFPISFVSFPQCEISYRIVIWSIASLHLF